MNLIPNFKELIAATSWLHSYSQNASSSLCSQLRSPYTVSSWMPKVHLIKSWLNSASGLLILLEVMSMASSTLITG